MNDVKIYIKSILIPVVIGFIIGLITNSSIDYAIINRPKISPPGWIFPVVWTILYILMGISYGLLIENKKNDLKTKSIYIAQLFLNYSWSIIFFTLKLRFLAIIWIILLVIFVIIMIVNFFKRNKISGILQIPYLLWCLFATYLTISIYLLN